MSTSWWRQTFRSVLSFVPQCLVPGLTFAFANIVMLFGLDYVYRMIGEGTATMDDLTRALVIVLASSISGLVLTLWSLWMWIFRLTAYARACLAGPEPPVKAVLAESLSAVRNRRAFITKFWLIASIYLVVPVVPLVLLLVVNIVSSPDYVGHALLGITLPLWASVCVLVALSALSILSMGFSFVSIATSAVSQLPAGEAASEALSLWWKNLLAVSIASVVVIVLNVVIVSPQAFAGLSNVTSSTRSPIIIDMLLQLWMGLSSACLWPLSVHIMCEVLRGQVK